MKSTRVIASSVAVLALVAAGCSKAEGNGGSSQSPANTGAATQAGTQGGTGDSLKTGPGVTDSTITLGALMDLTNVFAANSKSIIRGAKLYWKERNSGSKVCGRTVKLKVQNTDYDPQKAVSLYRGMSSNILSISPVLGSPVVSALKPMIDKDHMLTQLAGWTSEVLPDPNMQITGATYDIAMINAIDWLMREKGLKSGDTIGHIYFEGDFGGDALKGTEFAAEQHGLKVVKEQITPADTDLTTQVNKLKQAGVKAILLSAANPQTASVATVAASIGLDVPIVGNAPIFTPALLDTPAAKALEAHVYTATSMAPPSLNAPRVTKFRTAFAKAYPDAKPIQNGSMFGYASAQIMGAILDKACANQDLSRAGVLKAFHSLSAYDTEGTVAGTLDFSDPAEPPTRMDYISKVTAGVAGGLKAVTKAFVSPTAKKYKIGG